MMLSFLCPAVLPWLALVFSTLGAADPTWPSPIDELEDVMYLSTGYRSRGFAAPVTPCSNGVAAGRNTAAEMLRTGFHDMANTNIFNPPHGGIDGSLAMELNNGDNIGTGFNTTFTLYANYLNSRLSAADLVALGVYTSVRGCGGPAIPIRGGRTDATTAGPSGAIPQPENAIGTFKSQFQRMGFSAVDMIQMVACGHTLGGVHAGNFKLIVEPGTAPNDYQLFDTLNFDNKVLTNYIAGPPLDTDPLSLGISVKNTRNSDFKVFNSDSNATVIAMSDAAAFNSACSSILARMIDTVDPALTTLSDPIAPYEVKPAGLQLTLLSGGTLLKFSGDIRVRTTTRGAAQIASVQLAYKDRTGVAVGAPIMAAAGGTASGFDDTFSFYAFSANLPVATSISSFNVLVNLVGGTTTTYDNNGSGYPISDSVIVLTPQSCYNAGNLTVVAAVRNTVTTTPTLSVTQKIAVAGGRPIASPLPNLSTSLTAMLTGATSGPYTLYSASYAISSTNVKYGVSSDTFSDTFKDVSDLGVTCQALGTIPPTSTSSTVSSTSTSSSASASATLGIKPTIGAYSFQGCYTEGTGARALTGASFYDYTAMTLDKCSALCSGFTYWGVEYGGECYCGNTLTTGSIVAAPGDCNFVCPGSPVQYCGAGNRLEMYKLSSAVTSTSASSTSSTTSSSSQTSTSSRTSTSVTSTSSTSTRPSTSSTLTSSSSSSVVSTTSTSQTAVPTLRIVRSAGLYNYHGCFTEGSNGRALGTAFYPSDTNTVEQCVAACSPFKFAGAEYGRECWCADSFSTGSLQVADSDCSMTCAGDKYEYCGAGNRLTVYIRNGTDVLVSSSSQSTSSHSSTTVSSSSSSSSSTRSSTPSLSSSSSSSTSSSSTTRQTTSSSVTSSTTSSISTPTQTAPAIKPTIGLYTYYGCQTEATGVRALSAASFYNYTSMTLEQCASNCSGFKYWGVEYGGECYCGNSFGPGSIVATPSDCSFTCPGDKFEFCGAGNRLSVYVLTSSKK